MCNPRPRGPWIDGGWEVIANALACFESLASLQFRRVPGARPLLLMEGWMVGWQVSRKSTKIQKKYYDKETKFKKMQKYKKIEVCNNTNQLLPIDDEMQQNTSIKDKNTNMLSAS